MGLTRSKRRPRSLTIIAILMIVLFYFIGGLLILTKKKWAALTAIVLLGGDVIGRIAMVLTGLYPLDSLKQTFAILMGTAIAVFFAIYIGVKLKSFR